MGLLDNTTQQQYYRGSTVHQDYPRGNYQFISLGDVIDNFMATYIGEGKILDNVNRSDVSFHAHRALQELSYDTFKSVKNQEIEIPPALTMILPQDYVNYVKLTWKDSSGIEHIIYPTSKTSNPTPILQNDDGDYALEADGTLTAASATVVLDSEYKNILVGMRVESSSIPQTAAFTRVESVSNSGGITTITLWDGTNAVNSTYTGTEKLTFTPSDNTLVLQETDYHIVENLSWDTTDPKITAASASDISNIEVGMLVSHEEFDIGTRVVSVDSTVITTSSVANTAVASGGEVTFGHAKIKSDTFTSYKSTTPSENQDDYQDDTYWPTAGERYGLDPQHAQANGSFYIDELRGMIHFSSNISGKTVILHYISDSLGTDHEMQVHKFAEEAMYKWIAYGCLSARVNVPEYLIGRFKKEKFAETRKAKLRLSNIKLEEITQILRGKSKHIKH